VLFDERSSFFCKGSERNGNPWKNIAAPQRAVYLGNLMRCALCAEQVLSSKN